MTSVSIFPSSWSHLHYLRFCRSTQFVWFLTARLHCHFHSHSSYAHRARTARPHKFPLDAMKGVVRESQYLCYIRPHSLVSHGDTTSIIRRYITCSSICALPSIPDLRFGIWDDGVKKPGTSGSSGSPRNEPNPASPTTSHRDSASR